MTNLERTLVQWSETLEVEKKTVETLKTVFEELKEDFMIKRDLLEIYEIAKDRVEGTEKTIEQIKADIEAEKVAPVTYRQMKKILKELNENWKVDFVSATQGNDMGEMRTEKETKAFEESQTSVVVGWWFKGCNYRGKLEEQDSFYVYYDLVDESGVEVVSVETVCEDLQKALTGRYTVTVPESKTYVIIIERVVA